MIGEWFAAIAADVLVARARRAGSLGRDGEGRDARVEFAGIASQAFTTRPALDDPSRSTRWRVQATFE
jgi:hypothetical protein